MAAITINHLCGITESNDIRISYLFCNYKAQTDQSTPSLLTTLVKQLVQSRPEITAPVTHMYDQHSKRGSRPSLDEIFSALQSICSNYTVVHIMMDALDECADRDSTRDRFINKLRNLQATTNVRLLFTSHFIPEVTQNFQSNLILEVRASEENMRRFVTGQISRLPNCI